LCSLGIAQNAAPEWSSILSNQPERIRTQLISSSENSIQVNVQVPGFYTTNVQTPRGEAKVITMPKAVSTAQAGEPDMPMTGIPVMIGDRARMDIRVVNAQYQDYEGIEVAPSKGDFPRTIDPETVPYTYGECYSYDAFFPSNNVGMYDPYIIRDFRGQNMVVYPFAYNPVTKTLRVYYDMTVEMYKVDDNGTNVMETRRSNVVKMDPDFKSMYQRHFINYEAGMAKYTPLDETGDLLIICYDNFISSMTDFVNWKKTRGVNTTIVGTSTIGTSYSAIKTYIQNQYNANNNLTHVLLVGDVAQIPGYSYSGGGSDYSGLGDNAYGQVAGNDIYNDVIIGRFSASSAARVTTQCNRAITYERDLTTSASWLQKGVGISRKENGSGHNNEDDYQHMNNIRTDLLNYGYTTVTQRYANLTGYDASASTISSDINSGAGIVNYANHGQETAWGANSSGYVYYANSHVNALTN
jgi:gingipain R